VLLELEADSAVAVALPVDDEDPDEVERRTRRRSGELRARHLARHLLTQGSQLPNSDVS